MKSPGGSVVNTLEKNDDRTSAFSCVVGVSTDDLFGEGLTKRCGISLLTLVLLLTNDQNFFGLVLMLAQSNLSMGIYILRNCIMRKILTELPMHKLAA